ncbi:MAG: hypothetical protein QM723_37860 [Myxococcaceae bacterium]
MLVVVGCGLPDPFAPQDDSPTWYGKIGPLVGKNCGVCHQDNNIAPFALTTYDQVKTMSGAIRAAVQSKRMPPFPPDQSAESGCPKIDDSRVMADADRQALIDWIDAEMPEGKKRDLPEVKPDKPMGDPGHSWQMSAEYTSKATTADDYRCFFIDPKVVWPIPVAAVSVEPGNRQIVHHAAVFLIPPDQIDAVKKLDDADDGEGYDCFGGPGIAPAYPAGLWVPGNDAPLKPPYDGVGYYLPIGWAWVLQVHYNFATAHGSDRSKVTLWEAPWVTMVPHALVAGSTTFSIPPMTTGFVTSGDSSFIKQGDTPAADGSNAAEGRIYSVWAHEHLLGKSMQLDLVHPDGSKQCLLHINGWDFHWQSIYRLHDYVVAKPGDTLRATCTYDNMQDHAVGYGENTSDEMCFGSVGLIDK